MNRAVGLIAFVVVGLGLSGPAAADPLAGYGEVSSGPRETVGALADEFSGQLRTRLAAGVVFGSIALGAATSIAAMNPVSVERHGTSRLQFTFGPELRVRLSGRAGWQPYARLGVLRHIISSSSVTRRCADFDVCDAGFWLDRDGYSGRSIELGLGADYRFRHWAQSGMLFEIGVELVYEQFRFRVVDQDASSTRISTAPFSA